MKDNSQAMLVLVVDAHTGGTNSLYYWTEARQKKTDAVRVTPCRTSACGGLVAAVALVGGSGGGVGLGTVCRGRAPASERPYFFVTTASELTTPTTSVGAPSSESAIALQAAAVSKVSQLMQC